MFLPDLWRLNERLVTWFWDRGSYRAALFQAKAYTRLRPHDVSGWVTRYRITDELLGGDDGEVVLIAGMRRNPRSALLLHLHVTGLVENGLLEEAQDELDTMHVLHPDSAHTLITS